VGKAAVSTRGGSVASEDASVAAGASSTGSVALVAGVAAAGAPHPTRRMAPMMITKVKARFMVFTGWMK